MYYNKLNIKFTLLTIFILNNKHVIKHIIDLCTVINNQTAEIKDYTGNFYIYKRKKKIMKKLAIAFVALLFAGAAFAGNNVKNDSSWNINADRLASYLNLSMDQKDDFQVICADFGNEMTKAQSLSNQNDKVDAMQKAITLNLRALRGQFTQEQYEKYLRVLNATLQNKNIEYYSTLANR